MSSAMPPTYGSLLRRGLQHRQVAAQSAGRAAGSFLVADSERDERTIPSAAPAAIRAPARIAYIPDHAGCRFHMGAVPVCVPVTCKEGGNPLAPTLHKPDDLGFLGLVVPDEQITAFFQLGVDELIQGDGAVHQVRLGQAGPVLEVLQILRGLRYQGNSDPVSKRLPGNVYPRDAVTRASRHRYGSPFQGSSVRPRCRRLLLPARCSCCPAQAPVLCRGATHVVRSSGSGCQAASFLLTIRWFLYELQVFICCLTGLTAE